MEDNYYDRKFIKSREVAELFIKVIIFAIIVIAIYNMPLVLGIITSIIVISYFIKIQYENNKNHKIYIRLDSYGAIQVFDNSMCLIAILYKDKTIEYKRQLSFWKMTKIKDVSDHFEMYEYDLKVKEEYICL